MINLFSTPLVKIVIQLHLSIRFICFIWTQKNFNNLFQEIVKFPQECLRCDRESAYHATFSAKDMDSAMEFESENAAKVLTTEAILGAKKFMAGSGRGGKFNVNQEGVWFDH